MLWWVVDQHQMRPRCRRHVPCTRQQAGPRIIAVHIGIDEHKWCLAQQRPRALQRAAGIERRPAFVGVADVQVVACPVIESCTDLRAEPAEVRSEEHTSELQSLMRISYAVFCLKKKNIEKQV